MKRFFILLALICITFAANQSSGIYFDCYDDCYLQHFSGCEINATENNTTTNLVTIGWKSEYFSRDYYADNGYLEDLYCYYSSPIDGVTGEEKQWEQREKKKDEIEPPATSPQTPPIQPGKQGAAGLPPGVRGPPVNKFKKKIIKVEAEEEEEKPGKPNEKFVPKKVTTPQNFQATHYTCPTDCPDKSDDGFVLIRCSIIYNFKEKGKIDEILVAPYLSENTIKLSEKIKAKIGSENLSSKYTSKYSKIWSKKEDGKWVYDEVLVCEYYPPEGVISYVETRTPYDRLGCMVPVEPFEYQGNETWETFTHTKDTVKDYGVVSPPGYAEIEGDFYPVSDEPLQWAEQAFSLEEYDYGITRVLLNAEKYPEIVSMFENEIAVFEFGDYTSCILLTEKIEEASSWNGESCGILGEPDSVVFVSDETLERLENENLEKVVSEEWGRGIIYKPRTLGGSLEKLVMDVLFWFGNII